MQDNEHFNPDQKEYKAMETYKTLNSARAEAKKIMKAEHNGPVWITQHKRNGDFFVFVRDVISLREFEKVIETI